MVQYNRHIPEVWIQRSELAEKNSQNEPEE